MPDDLADGSQCLYDCAEEQGSTVMDAPRRQRVLRNRLELWKEELGKRERTRVGA